MSSLVLLIAALVNAPAGGVVHDARFVVSDGAAFDELGVAVALGEDAGGERALVGARHHAHSAGLDRAGAAYVFRREATGWIEEAELLAPDAAADDELGSAVALAPDGALAVLGAPLDDDRGDASGSVHVFRLEAGAWVHEGKLTALDGAAGDRFGGALALTADTLAIGARQADFAGADSGSVYVYRRSGTSWAFEARLEAPDAAAADFFGSALSLAADRLAVGAPFDDDAGSGSGSVRLFERAGSVWTPGAKLVAPLGAAGDQLGSAVALATAPSGARVLTGAPGVDLAAPDGGGAHVFVESGGLWSEETRLFPAVAEPSARFGAAVVLDSAGARAIVGAPQAAPLAVQSGAAHVFARDASDWHEVERLVPLAGGALDRFGTSVAASTSGERFLAGSFPDSHAGPDPGAADVWRWTDLARTTCEGEAALCPCANGGAAGHGCAGPTGIGVRLALVEHAPGNAGGGAGGGTALVAARGFPPAATPAVVVFRGASALASPTLFGDGLLCVASPVVRVASGAASNGASLHALVHGAGPGPFLYQAWFRNTPASFCDPAASWSTSSGLELSWP